MNETCQLCHHDWHPGGECGEYIGIPATWDEPGMDLCDCDGRACCDVCMEGATATEARRSRRRGTGAMGDVCVHHGVGKNCDPCVLATIARLERERDEARAETARLVESWSAAEAKLEQGRALAGACAEALEAIDRALDEPMDPVMVEWAARLREWAGK